MYETRGTFFVKNGIYKGKGLDLRAEPPRINICWTTTTSLWPAKISAAILRERMRIKNLHLPDETYRHWISSHWISSLHCSFQEYTKLGDVHPRTQERIKKMDPAEYSNMTNPHTFSRYTWSWLYENCVFLHK